MANSSFKFYSFVSKPLLIGFIFMGVRSFYRQLLLKKIIIPWCIIGFIILFIGIYYFTHGISLLVFYKDTIKIKKIFRQINIKKNDIQKIIISKQRLLHFFKIIILLKNQKKIFGYYDRFSNNTTTHKALIDYLKK